MTGGYQPDWDIDRDYGEQGERFWREFMDAPPGAVEVKHTRYLSGYVYVELRQNPRGKGEWKPSGLATTRADWWVFIIGDSFMAVWFPVDLLRWAVGQGAGIRKECVDGDNPTDGVILHVAWLIQESGRWHQSRAARNGSRRREGVG